MGRIEESVDSYFSAIISRFEQEHQQLRTELLNLLEHSLEIHRTSILGTLKGNKGNTLNSQHSSLKNSIIATDNDISQLLKALGSNNYRKTIADVVTRDFNRVIVEIRDARTHF